MLPHYLHFLIALLGSYVRCITGTCSLCGEYPLPNDGLLHEGHGIKCRDLFDQTTAIEDGSAQCSLIQLTAFQIGCCHEQYVPENVCSVCPDGSPFQTSISIPGATGRSELTCADIAAEGSFLDFFTTPGDCSDTFLQRSAAWCRCPGHDVQCHLCPNGASPMDLHKTEKVFYGWSCENFRYITALMSHGECVVAEQVLEFDAQAFCCEGVELPNACDFCPEGQQVLYPDNTITSPYGVHKCSDIEESLQMLPTQAGCDLVKQSLSTAACCGIPGESSALSTSKFSDAAIFAILYILLTEAFGML
jgi:hypothetical protein